VVGPFDKLMGRVAARIPDRRVFRLIRSYLTAGVLSRVPQRLQPLQHRLLDHAVGDPGVYGLCVRAILVEEGYARVERGVRTDESDDLFTTGSVYAKAETEDDDHADGSEELVELLAVVAEKLLTGGGRAKLMARLELLD
jgi:hypothetical protein